MLGIFRLDGTHPGECLKIGSRVLAWSVSSKTWRGRHRYRCASSPIPSGVVKLSPIDGNVVDREALGERLRSLVGPARRLRFLGKTLLTGLPRRVTLVLPDLAVRATVLQLEQFPVRREEQEALIRWRLGQEQRLPLTGAKFTWQVFPPRQPRGLYMVLVVVVQEAILGEYEAACEAAGLLPQEVTVASFRLFDLWLKTAGGARCLDRDLAWVTVSDGGMTCMIFHDGRPVFARTKFLAGDEGIESRESIARIVRETELSILACREHVPELRLARLVLMTEADVPALEDQLGHALGVSTDHLQWDHVQAAGWTHDGGNTSLAMLPVVAGLM
jgi:type IV pilus assembly protein PilM